jgi:tetratricopeptide (TPR) repeat protein
LGNAYRALGQVEKAIEQYEQALAIAREIGDRQGEGIRAWNLGLLYEKDDPEKAVALMSIYVEYEEEIGHPDAQADAQQVADIAARINK